MTTSLHRILFGSLVLSDGTTERPMDTDYWFSVMGENFSTGQPELIARTIETFMLDGAHVIKDGDGTRQITVYVGIHGPDTQALTDGEVALTLETGKRNSFIVETHDEYGPPTLFEVVMSSFGQVPDDLAEVMRCERVYALNITALPQAFSTTVTVTPALTSAAVPAPVTISDGTSATGWTSPDGAITVVSGRLSVPSSTPTLEAGGQTYDTYRATMSATKALSAVDFSAAPYISADVVWASSNQTFGRGSLAASITAEVDGAALTLVASQWISATSMWWLTWRSTDTSASSLTILADSGAQVPHDDPAPGMALLIDNVKYSDGAPVTGTARQKFRTIEVPGSVRTPGVLCVSHSTNALGDVLVHTCNDLGNGYNPAVAQYGSGGTVTADAALVSGNKRTGAAVYFDTPVSTLTPGTYQVMVRGKRNTGSGVLSIPWTAQARIGTTNFGPVRSDTREVTLSAVDYSIFTLTTLELPTDRVGANSVAVQRLTISQADLDIDEVWLFFVSDHLGNRGYISQVPCGTGTPAAGGPANRLFLKSATIDDPLPGAFIGTQADESDSFFAADALWEQHSFAPGSLLTTTVTTGTLDAETSYAARPAGHSHAPS